MVGLAGFTYLLLPIPPGKWTDGDEVRSHMLGNREMRRLLNGLLKNVHMCSRDVWVQLPQSSGALAGSVQEGNCFL